jgi:O-antigen/teichoic acid export membrane protein
MGVEPGRDGDAVESSDVRTTAELTEATASGLRAMTYARIAVELVLLGSMVVLARLISPAEFGMFAIVVIVQELAMSMPMEGIGSALVQRKSIDRVHLQAGLALSLLVAVVLTVVTLVLAETVVQSVYGQRTAWLIELATPWFLVCAVYAVPTAVLRRRLDFGRLSRLDLANNVVRAAVSIALAAGGMGAEALVLGNFVGCLACLVAVLAYSPVPWPRWNRAAVADLLPYGGPAALAVVAWTGFRNGDYAIVGARLGAAQAGFYWRGYQLAVEYQKKIGVLMTQMAFPVLARSASPEEMFALRQRMVRLLTVVLFPMLTLLVVLAPVVVPWLFGAEWTPAVLPTQILAAGGAATLVADAAGSALMAEGRSRALLGFGVAHFAVYLGAVLLVASHGIAAVATAAAVVHTVFLIVVYELLFRGHDRSGVAQLVADLAPASLGSAALAAPAIPLAWALKSAGVPVPIEVAVVSAVGAVAYLATLRLAFPAAAQDLASALGRILPERALGLLRRRPRAGRAAVASASE